jgi:hypothetical protein
MMVLVDKLTKATHFIPVKLNHEEANIVEIYMRKITRINGVPHAIVSHNDPKFTSNLRKGLFEGFGTNLNFSTTYHPNSDGKIERVIWENKE